MVLGDEDGYADRSFGNLPEIQTMVAGELNAYDILVNDWVVFTDETLPGGSDVEAVADDRVRSRRRGSRPTIRGCDRAPPRPTPTVAAAGEEGVGS